MTAVKKQQWEAKSTVVFGLKRIFGLTAQGNSLAFSIIALLIVTVSAACHAQEIVLIHGRHAGSDELKQIQQIAEFYSLRLDSVEIGSPAAVRTAVTHLRQRSAIGVLISYDALAALDRKQVLEALQRPGSRNVPTLIFAIAADKSPELRLWSGGDIRACAPTARGYRPSVLSVEDVPPLARTLAGSQLPAVAAPVCTLQFDPATGAEAVLAAEGGGSSGAILARARYGNIEMLFAPRMEPFDTSWVGKPAALPEAFSSLAPFLLFLNHAAGDYGWHLNGHYANLTIDDPWLIEPYGHLHYGALLEEMEKHNFHTTLGFIPWNYDRSEEDVVKLIRAHPERYSISIHGDNHTHREFGDYRSSPLPEQITNLKQAVARMDRFQELTGIPYDRFMIFPHSVAPEATFAALKTLDFMGTANSVNVPAGSSLPAEPTFLLRPYTSNYGHFLSLFRYSAEEPISRVEIAIHCFLGNPLLFYGHEKLFDNGIGEFDKFADLVNQIQPDTQWKSLGEIARHLYLVRRRGDGEFDVRMFSDEMALRNPTQQDSVFHIEWEGNNSAAMPNLDIDDSPARAERSGNMLTFRLMIPAGHVRRVRLHYQSEGDTAADLGRRSLYASILRRVSDFRDLSLSRSSLGRVVTEAYYRYGWDSLELRAERVWRTVAACVGIALAGIWIVRRRTPIQKAGENSQTKHRSYLSRRTR